MPTYTYRCRECGNRLELLQTHKEMRETRPRLRCQRCEAGMEFVFPAPALSTDTTFMANRDDGFGGDNVARKRAYAKARREGTDIAGKVWAPQLNSWVGSKAEVAAKAAAKGRGVTGLVNATGPDVPPPEPVRYEVADSLVESAVQDVVDDHNGDVTPRERAAITEKVKETSRGKQFDS